MPRRKQPVRRRRRRRGARRGAVYGAAAYQLYKDVNKLKNLINVEFKWVDTQLNSTISSSGTFLLLNGIAQGDAAQTRDGAQARLKSLESSANFTLNAAATNATIRCIIFIDLQTDATTPALADVLDNSGLTDPTYASRNLDYRNRFLILKDYRFSLSSTGMQRKNWHNYRKLDLKTVYSGTGATIASIRSQPLYILYVSDSASNNPAITAHHRIRFIDN